MAATQFFSPKNLHPLLYSELVRIYQISIGIYAHIWAFVCILHGEMSACLCFMLLTIKQWSSLHPGLQAAGGAVPPALPSGRHSVRDPSHTSLNHI